VTLARKLEVSNSYLSEIENGLKSPTLDLLQKYSELFKMPLSTIMLFSEALEGDRKPGARLRVAAADKVLKLLEWIEDRESVTNA
jgi:transcriptional regulator with XRE-family HTH domain